LATEEFYLENKTRYPLKSNKIRQKVYSKWSKLKDLGTIARPDIGRRTRLDLIIGVAQPSKSPSLNYITYELLGLVIKRSSNIVSLFKVLKNIRIDA
jgi:hypothetical protein